MRLLSMHFCLDKCIATKIHIIEFLSRKLPKYTKQLRNYKCVLNETTEIHELISEEVNNKVSGQHPYFIVLA